MSHGSLRRIRSRKAPHLEYIRVPRLQRSVPFDETELVAADLDLGGTEGDCAGESRIIPGRSHFCPGRALVGAAPHHFGPAQVDGGSARRNSNAAGGKFKSDLRRRIRPILVSLGPAVERHQTLETNVQGLVRLNEQAEAMRSELSSVMKQRRELAIEGSKAYRRLTADLQAHHGLDSAELIRYGLKPKGRPRKVARKKVEEAAKAEAGKTQVEVAPA